jgi:ubiquinone/menaquinone biosynthesis C-methylase UbiE
VTRWAEVPGSSTGDAYDETFRALAAAGHDVHGEANLVASYGPRRVLDAGCGTGRVAVELARRGIEVWGVDLDERMLASARAKDAAVRWIRADLAALDTGDVRFEVVVAAGNVLIFVAPGTEPAVIASCARALTPGGRFVTGFQLRPGGYDLEHLDADAVSAGLVLEDRWATWEREPWEPGGNYAVSVFRSDPQR